MIGQVTIGKSFGGVVRYVMGKPEAKVLDENGLRSATSTQATQDFNVIRRLRSNVKNAVWHTSLSFAYDDQLDSKKMITIGKDYLKQIGLKKNQFLMVQHNDTKHKHLHIISNRIGFDGQVVSDRWCKNKTASICDKLEEKYGLVIAQKRKRKTRENDKISHKKMAKKELYTIIKQGLDDGLNSYVQLEKYLRNRGVNMYFQKQKTGRINGVAFQYGQMKFKGSAIDRSFSFRRLLKKLSYNKDQNKEEDYENRGKI